MNITEGDNKKTLRAALRLRLAGLNEQAIASKSSRAAGHLFTTREYQQASALMLFLPLRHEIDATAIALRAWQEDKLVTVPLVGYAQKHMIAVTLRSLEEAIVTDHFGVRTPETGEPVPAEMLELVLVPGLGFDRTGRRIGRGGGFYDRYLSQAAFHGTICGLAFSEQIVPQIPASDHDVSVDMLVTEEGLMRFDAKKA